LVHNYPGANQDEAWEAFLLDLEALPAEFKAIGINDNIFIDGYERARNLAVVCDAEQIICAMCDKATNTFNYISGGNRVAGDQGQDH